MRVCFSTRRYIVPLVTFCLVSLCTSGLLAAALLIPSLRDPLTGAHPPDEYSLDLLAPFIYGGHWRFASLTSGYWSQLRGNIHESSVHLGLSVVILIIYAWFNRKTINDKTALAVLSSVPVLYCDGARPSSPRRRANRVAVQTAVCLDGNIDAFFQAVRMSRSHDGDGEFVCGGAFCIWA